MRRIILIVIAFAMCLSRALGLSPILQNNTFSAGSFAHWTADTPTYTAGCSSGADVFIGLNAVDQDGDTGYASGDSGNACFDNNGGFAKIGLSQTFTIPGTPTAQTVHFYYLAPLVDLAVFLQYWRCLTESRNENQRHHNFNYQPNG